MISTFSKQDRSGSVIKFRTLGQNCQAKTKCVICGEGHLHKGCPKKRKSNQSVLTVEDHMLLAIKRN